MALAAQELTEQQFLSLCASDHDRLFPALARHQQFHGLFRHQMTVLPDTHVDLHATLSLAVQACFETAAGVIVGDFEVTLAFHSISQLLNT